MNQDLSRVSGRLASAITDFVGGRKGVEFTAAELHAHVEQATGKAAPASADRVLRDLRQRGKLSYTLLSRSKSLYRSE
jgi:hypothetical protein